MSNVKCQTRYILFYIHQTFKWVNTHIQHVFMCMCVCLYYLDLLNLNIYLLASNIFLQHNFDGSSIYFLLMNCNLIIKILLLVIQFDNFQKFITQTNLIHILIVINLEKVKFTSKRDICISCPWIHTQEMLLRNWKWLALIIQE